MSSGIRSSIHAVAPSTRVLAEAAETFALLASPARLKIVWLISDAEIDVQTLSTLLEMSGPAVSQHLAKLRLAGLVSVRRDGRRQLYTVDDPHIVTLARQAIEHHEELLAGAVTRGRDETEG